MGEAGRQAAAAEAEVGPTGPSDAALVAGLKAGDELAAETLVRCHGGWMLKVARHYCGDAAAAEDCVQEAFLNVLRKIDGFEARASLRTWLHRIVVNQALMRRRVQVRRKEDTIDALLPAFDAEGHRIAEPSAGLTPADEELARQDLRLLVRRKIGELPESYRVVLELRDIEDLDTREVAQTLGLTETNVKVRLHRARSALRTLLEPVLQGEL